MKFSSRCVSPSIYSETLIPNTVNLNNSFKSKEEYLRSMELGNYEIAYRRCSKNMVPNVKALTATVASLYEVPVENCVLCCSGVSAFYVLAKSFSTIYVIGTYSEVTQVLQQYRCVYLDSEEELTKHNIQNSLIIIDSMRSISLYTPDIKKLSTYIHGHNSKLCIDNSILNIYNYNPLNDGADFVVESLAKYVSGHNNCMLGAIVSKDVDLQEEKGYGNIIRVMGISPNPVDCYLAQIGIATLPLRMERIKSTTETVKKYLLSVRAKISSDSRCGLIYIVIQTNTMEPVYKNIVNSFEVIQFGDTFGAPFTVGSIFKHEGNLIVRLSIGLEDPVDIIRDLEKIRGILTC